MVNTEGIKALTTFVPSVLFAAIDEIAPWSGNIDHRLIDVAV
jgi:hypothetical protein